LRKAGEQRAWLSSSDTVAFRSIGQGEGLFRRLDVCWPFAFRLALLLSPACRSAMPMVSNHVHVVWRGSRDRRRGGMKFAA
jgi:hypothetical protein